MYICRPLRIRLAVILFINLYSITSTQDKIQAKHLFNNLSIGPEQCNSPDVILNLLKTKGHSPEILDSPSVYVSTPPYPCLYISLCRSIFNAPSSLTLYIPPSNPFSVHPTSLSILLFLFLTLPLSILPSHPLSFSLSHLLSFLSSLPTRDRGKDVERDRGKGRRSIEGRLGRIKRGQGEIRGRDNHRVLIILFWLSFAGCPVLTILFWVSCPHCPYLAALFWSCILAVLSVTVVLYWLSYSSCPVLASKSTSITALLTWQSCLGVPILAVLSWLSRPYCPILNILS